jgi:hypothetical protein
MNFEEAMIFADKVVFDQTGKHLDDLQLGVIEGVFNRQTYGEIAKELKCGENYVKDTGYRLWQLFSEAFGEEVNKTNLKSALFRHYIVNSFNFNVFGNVEKEFIIGSVYQCPYQEQSSEFFKEHKQDKINIASRLKNIGLSDQQIADCLELELEIIEKIDL